MTEGMTKEQFIAEYCAASNMPVEEIMETRVCLPCSCDEYDYKHWAMVTRDDGLIESHVTLYAPELTGGSHTTT